MIRTNYTPRARVLPHVAAHATLRLRGYDCTLDAIEAAGGAWVARGQYTTGLAESDAVAFFCWDWANPALSPNT